MESINLAIDELSWLLSMTVTATKIKFSMR